MDGVRVGLDYGKVETVMRLYKIPEDEWSDAFDRVRVLEAEALDAIHSQLQDKQHREEQQAKSRRS